MTWTIQFARKTKKDITKVHAANLGPNSRKLLAILKKDPYEGPCEELSGNLKGYYSRRINIKHRLIYRIDDARKTIEVVSIWSHYE